MLLRYDYSNMFADGAVSGEELTNVLRQVIRIKDDLFKRRAEISFIDLPDSKILALIENLSKKYRQHFDNLLVIGIGGSDLGTRTIYDAFVPSCIREKKRVKGRAMKIYFMGNTDPEEAADVLSRLNLKRTIVNVVSKSGETAEILANFLLVRKLLEAKLGKAKTAKQIVATTDPVSGFLRREAGNEGWAILPIPANLGGRFSVLSPVGLFPAATAGIKISGLIAGANKVVNDEYQAKIQTPAAIFSALSYLLYKKGKNISVFMPYAASLWQLAMWFRQLWAENLGKREDVGPTPVAALGVVDQHSQLQLYQDGPKDKIITFLEVERFRKNFQVPTYQKSPLGGLSVQGHSFEEIIHAERASTAEALRNAGRPNGTLFISKITEETLGALFQFFMFSSAYLGGLLGVNAFNQPGVEAMKKNLLAILQGGKILAAKQEKSIFY